MFFDCKDRRAVITGGSRGIGRAIALAFADCGAKVSICARGSEALEQTRSELAERAAVAHAQTCDLAEPEAVKCYVDGAAEALGGIDVLINNATGFENNREMWDACL